MLKQQQLHLVEVALSGIDNEIYRIHLVVTRQIIIYAVHKHRLIRMWVDIAGNWVVISLLVEGEVWPIVDLQEGPLMVVVGPVGLVGLIDPIHQEVMVMVTVVPTERLMGHLIGQTDQIDQTDLTGLTDPTDPTAQIDQIDQIDPIDQPPVQATQGICCDHRKRMKHITDYSKMIKGHANHQVYSRASHSTRPSAV